MAYCDRDDVISILSNDGVAYAVDDNRSGDNETAENVYVTDAIERADSDISMHVQKYYNTTTLTGNTWVKWCSATLTAVDLMTRNGNQIPAGLWLRYQRYLELLAQIATGTLEIPGATPLTSASGMVMENLEHDARYRTTRIRTVQETSAGTQTSQLPVFHSNRTLGARY